MISNEFCSEILYCTETDIWTLTSSDTRKYLKILHTTASNDYAFDMFTINGGPRMSAPGFSAFLEACGTNGQPWT